MSAYHQMGHDSENLLFDEGLGAFKGTILSPVNYPQHRISAQIEQLSDRDQFETIFDPQLYVPSTERQRLRDWTYFPSDVETADLSSEAWWNSLIDGLVSCCEEFRPNAVCSPAVLPRTYSDEYYARLVAIGDRFAERATGCQLSPLQTAIVGVADLGTPFRAEGIASILSQSKIDRIYLVLVADVAPRRELTDVDAIKGAMRLISLLERAGLRTLVSHASSDMLLWKAAGATDSATGKFFNLRRFTPSRFDEPTGAGGGQLPYWFEEALVAFLRESDLLRIQDLGMMSESSATNPYRQEILQRIQEGRAWLGLAWRQYMFWFADAERRIERGELDIRELLRTAERRWLELEDRSILMEEPRNDGAWLRPWRRALTEFAP